MMRTHKVDQPIVRFKQPFVRENEASYVPSISKNMPSIRTTGFTLIELVVTLTIAGILATIAAPALSKFVSSNRLTAATNGFIADLQLARTEAIKRGVDTTVCKSTDGTSCTTAGTWASGWIVLAGAVLVKVHEALASDTTVTAAADAIVFSRHGLISPTGGGAGNYILCNSKLRKTRVVDVAATGRPSLSEGTC